MDDLTEDELDAIQRRTDAATPGPWHLRYLDDEYAANLVAVSTDSENDLQGAAPRWPDFDAGTIVAATLVQSPHRYVDIADERWDENAAFIAHARQDIPRLVAEVRRLRAHR